MSYSRFCFLYLVINMWNCESCIGHVSVSVSHILTSKSVARILKMTRGEHKVGTKNQNGVLQNNFLHGRLRVTRTAVAESLLHKLFSAIDNWILCSHIFVMYTFLLRLDVFISYIFVQFITFLLAPSWITMKSLKHFNETKEKRNPESSWILRFS